MDRNLRSDVKRWVLLLLGVEPRDRDDVRQGLGAAAPDVGALAASVRARGRAEAAGLDRSQIAVPATLALPDEQDGYRAKVVETAEGQVYAGLPPTSIDVAQPDLMRGTAAAAESAAAELATVDAELRHAQKEEREEEKRFVLEQERHGRKRTFARRLRNLAVVGVALFVLDAGVVFLGQAHYAGAFQYGTLSEVPPQIWAQAALSALPALIAGVVLGIVAVKLLSRFGLSRALSLLFAIFVLLLLAAVAVGQGLMRWLGALPTEELTAERVSLGAFGMLLTTAISSLVVAGSVVWAHARIEQLLGLHRAAVDREESHEGRMALIRKDVTIHAGGRAALSEAIRVPDELRSRFEAAVASWSSKLRAHEAAVEDRVRRAAAALEQLSTLSETEQEAVIDEVYRIRRDDDDDEPPTGSVALRNGVAKAGTLLSALLVAAHLGLAGCGGVPPRPFSVVLGCDATGEDPEAVCSRYVVERELERWYAIAKTKPGSTFRVVLSAESHAATRVTDSIVVPSHWTGAVRAAQQAWIERQVATLGKLELPSDELGDRRRNKSDHLGLLLVAAREARALAGHDVDLVFATDGRTISGRINAERRIPTANEATAVLRAQGASLDLSAFRQIEMCGVHHFGMRPGEPEALENYWRGFIAATGGPEPSISPSCRERFPTESSLHDEDFSEDGPTRLVTR